MVYFVVGVIFLFLEMSVASLDEKQWLVQKLEEVHSDPALQGGDELFLSILLCLSSRQKGLLVTCKNEQIKDIKSLLENVNFIIFPLFFLFFVFLISLNGRVFHHMHCDLLITHTISIHLSFFSFLFFSFSQ